jgi:hypothetical protein
MCPSQLDFTRCLQKSRDLDSHAFLEKIAKNPGTELVVSNMPPENSDFLGVFSATRVFINIRPGNRPMLRVGTVFTWCKWLVKKIIVKLYAKVFGDSGAVLSERMTFISTKPN